MHRSHSLALGCHMFSGWLELVGLLVTAAAIWQASRVARRDRGLQTGLTLIMWFRDRWEADWRKTLREIEQRKTRSAVLAARLEDELFNMLNWVDFLGKAYKSKTLEGTEELFESLKPQIVRILNVGQEEVEAGVKEEGLDYWDGVLSIGERYGIHWIRRLGEEAPIQGEAKGAGSFPSRWLARGKRPYQPQAIRPKWF